MAFQAVYRRLGSRENAILAWCEVTIRNRVAKTPDFSIGVNVASMSVVMGRAGVFGGSFLRGAFCRFFLRCFYIFWDGFGWRFLPVIRGKWFCFYDDAGIVQLGKNMPTSAEFLLAFRGCL